MTGPSGIFLISSKISTSTPPTKLISKVQEAMADTKSTDDIKAAKDTIFPNPFAKDSHYISPPNTAEQGPDKICGNRLTFIGDGTPPKFDLFKGARPCPPKFDFARKQSSLPTKKLSVSFQERFETPNKKRKVREDDSELEEDDENEKAWTAKPFMRRREKTARFLFL
jgi:hypothetical protein